MNINLEQSLRDCCHLLDWFPTQQQLETIKHDIDAAIASGKALSRSECQDMVAKHCGCTNMFVVPGEDDADLTAFFTKAIK